MTRTRRLLRFASAALCLLSLLAGLAASWLWWRSYRGGDQWTFLTREGRQTLQSDAGRLTLLAPPPAPDGPPTGEGSTD